MHNTVRAGTRDVACRSGTRSALAGLVRDAGGSPVPCGIMPELVGARDATADAVADLGKPGIFCHGLAVKSGKPTLLAECDGVPVIGLPGDPLSALVVFRLVGAP